MVEVRRIESLPLRIVREGGRAESRPSVSPHGRLASSRAWCINSGDAEPSQASRLPARETEGEAPGLL